VLSIEGPRFSSRAESKLYRNWGADVINMYTAPEVILANELGIPYATLALCTAFDSWRHDDGQTKDAATLIDENREKMVKVLTYAMKKVQEQG
jgi:5'-methylthioadenosine phosphorylase